MGWLDKLLRRQAADDGPPDELVRESTGRVIKWHSRLRLASRCDERLSEAVAISLRYIGDLMKTLPPAHEASARAWASDPYIHAFFGSADEVAPTLSRSSALRSYFKRAAGDQEAYAVLGMAMSERTTLGVAMEEGGAVRSDVQQTTLGFGDHQVRMCGTTDAELRQEITRRLLDQLAIEALAMVSADQERREELDRERALLATRLQLLRRQGAGMHSVIGGEAEADPARLAKLREEIEHNEREIESLGSRAELLEHQLDRFCEVFGHPETRLNVAVRRLRLSRMNVVLPEHGTEQGEQLELRVAHIPGNPPRDRVFCLVRFSRADLVEQRSVSEEAARLLG